MRLQVDKKKVLQTQTSSDIDGFAKYFHSVLFSPFLQPFLTSGRLRMRPRSVSRTVAWFLFLSRIRRRRRQAPQSNTQTRFCVNPSMFSLFSLVVCLNSFVPRVSPRSSCFPCFAHRPRLLAFPGLVFHSCFLTVQAFFLDVVCLFACFFVCVSHVSACAFLFLLFRILITWQVSRPLFLAVSLESGTAVQKCVVQK